MCISDDGERSVVAKAFSGLAECRNNVACAGEPDRGPIPPGTYQMIESDKYGGSWWLAESWITRQICRRLHIGRCQFFLHSGYTSQGCINVDKQSPSGLEQWEQIKKVLNGDPKNTLTVVD